MSHNFTALSSNDLAYLAGLFDGEGSFSIQVMVKAYRGREFVNFSPRMSMTLKYGTEALQQLVRHFGGKLYHYDDGMVRWHLGTRTELVRTAESLLPYLIIKRKIAERFLQALAIFPETRKSHLDGERSWTHDMVRQVAEIAFSLNPYRKSSKGLDYLTRLARVYDVAA